MNKILITGGAGFIGSNLALKLISKGYNITVLDNLSEQIHGLHPENDSPLYQSIKNKVNFIFCYTPRRCHITAIIPVFQTGDTGSTPVDAAHAVT